jgi:hypothetical protein
VIQHWGIAHAVLFNIVWFVVVLAVSKPGGETFALGTQLSFIVFCLAASGMMSGRRGLLRELRLITYLAALGLLVDGALARAGFVAFPYTERFIWGYPLWMLGMWGCFATTFSSSLAWIIKRPVAQVLFGSLGGPMSLFAAQRFGAVAFPNRLDLTLAIVAVEWAIVMLIAARLSTRRRVISGHPSILMP